MNGLGTQLNPFLISTPDDLQAINNKLSAYYELTNDIDMTAFNFIPIGRVYPFFNGHIDGKGFKISNLKIISNVEYTGFIARTNGGSVRNLGLENVHIESNSDHVGGLIALNSLSDIISSCYVNGVVKQNNISKSYCGGLIGRNFGNIFNCYSNCEVTGGRSVGGFCGLIDYANSIIQNCYTSSIVNGSVDTGGFLGQSGLNINYRNCYYNSQINNITISGIEGRTIDELKNQVTYVNWDFKTIWYIDNDLPRLRVFGVPNDSHKEYINIISTISEIDKNISVLKKKNTNIFLCISPINTYLNTHKRVLRVLDEYLSSIHSNVIESHLRVNRSVRKSNSYSTMLFSVLETYYPTNITPIYIHSVVCTNNSNMLIQQNQSNLKYIINPSKSEVI